MLSVDAALSQYVLSLSDRDLQVDGIWGPKSARAFSGAPQITRDLVVTLLTGIDADLLRVDPDVDQGALDMATKNADEVAAALIRASRSTAIPLTWLVAFAKIESNFNPSATNGRSKGLFQMQSDAWNEASSVVPLGDYDTNWRDPFQNALAAAGYITLNLKELRRYGMDAFSEPRWIYMAHQQGAAGLNELVQLSYGKEVSTTFVTEKKMLGNTAPGSSATTDRVKFYNNWMNHLANYFDGNPFD
jgi:hypothetical protein